MDDVRINAAVSVDNFWNALEIYYKHPNAVNKQVLLHEHVFGANLRSLDQSECRFMYEKLNSELSRGCLTSDDTSIITVIKPEFVSDVFSNSTGMYLLIRRLIPKLNKYSFNFYEFIFLDKNHVKVYIFTGSAVTEDSSNNVQSESQDPFVILKFDFIQLGWECDNVKISYNKSLSERGANWIKVTFVTKFTKLLVSESNSRKNCGKFTFESQVDVVEYYKLYEKLKQKHAKTLIENWTETTDPKKFVYEDIGIAAYLILLWDGRSGKKRQKFVDLGCGNGLLVHILNSEGHAGVGLDIRKRKIWDTYPKTTILKEETIIPTVNAYPEADWLIGNHSDELTAWLPILARKSNRFCQYFALPCCPYQLNGKKFQRKNSDLSSYQDFILYVRNISEICQFKTHVDKLRIPSTKRVCLLGFNSSGVTEEQYVLIIRRIVNLVEQECHNADALDFTPREAVQAVKNCTKVPYNVREDILRAVMNKLLEENVLYSVTKNGETCFWNRGGKIGIGDLAASVNEDLLRQLKSECKGLQTLLKNHHFLFEVSRGRVQFRDPERMVEICKKVQTDQGDSRWKRKNCWLFANHPNGCPLPDDACSYAHVK